jgi:S-adenosylmethionine hydrolase
MKPPRKQNKPIALLTDFGTRDGFVGTVKAVILRLNPRAVIIDLSHDISPQNIDEAAYVLWSAYRYFPDGTIFVVVVDPGVGTGRRIICAEGERHLFLAPENGVLRYIECDGGIKRKWNVRENRYFLPTHSSTFHGRDIFAPAAGHLSLGLAPSKLGKSRPLEPAPAVFKILDGRTTARQIGKVIYIDRFGNLITNLRTRGEIKSYAETVSLPSKGIRIRGLSRTYAEGDGKHAVAVINSSGLIEIGVRNGNASESFKVGLGERVVVNFKRRG